MCQSSTKIKHIIYNILIAYILQSALGIVYINCQIYFSSTSAKGDMDVFKLHCDVFPGVLISYRRSIIIKSTFRDLTSREERGIKIRFIPTIGSIFGLNPSGGSEWPAGGSSAFSP